LKVLIELLPGSPGRQYARVVCGNYKSLPISLKLAEFVCLLSQVKGSALVAHRSERNTLKKKNNLIKLFAR
jgi:hypothetical protein